jgi:hypothetical protein
MEDQKGTDIYYLLLLDPVLRVFQVDYTIMRKDFCFVFLILGVAMHAS